MLDTTIIITTFDRPKCLDRLVTSIFQYYSGIDIIIVDNGLTKYEPQEVFRDKVKIIRAEPDAGLSACRNIAVDNVKTKYTFVIDDDVIFNEATKIHNFISVLNEDQGIEIVGGILEDEGQRGLPAIHKIPGIENILAQCDLDLEIRDGTLFKYPSNDKIKQTKDGTYYKYVDFVLNFFLAKTSLFNNFRWDNDLKLAEHFDFFLRLKNLGRYNRRVAFTPSVRAEHKNDQREDEDYNKYRSRSGYFFKMSKEKHDLKDVVFIHRDWQNKIIRKNEGSWESPMFIGIGTGRCGTKSLAKLVDNCGGCSVFHEANWQTKQHKFNTPLPWEFDEKLAKQRIQNMKKRNGIYSLFGDVAFYYLNYLDYFIENYPTLKIVHIYRDKESVVNSYLAKTSKEESLREYDNWTTGAKSIDKIWTHCFPKYDTADKKEAIGLYYDEYIRATKKYKNHMIEINVEEINTFVGKNRIFEYLEIPYSSRQYDAVRENAILNL